jgi:flagellar basal body-associated protein FliL
MFVVILLVLVIALLATMVVCMVRNMSNTAKKATQEVDVFPAFEEDLFNNGVMAKNVLSSDSETETGAPRNPITRADNYFMENSFTQ